MNALKLLLLKRKYAVAFSVAGVVAAGAAAYAGGAPLQEVLTQALDGLKALVGVK